MLEYINVLIKMLELNKIYNMDCLEGLKQIDSEIVNLIITDPPYNINYHYIRYKDIRNDYWEWCSNWLKECYRVLHPTGSIYVKQQQKNSMRFGYLMEKIGFKFQNMIIWKNISGYPRKSRFVKSYEVILFFSKTDDFKFNTYAQTVPNKFRSWTPTRDKRLKGQMTDLWTDIKFVHTGAVVHPEAILKETDKLSRKSMEKAHPCQMPSGLARRAILFSSNENDLVIDIFNGSGTTTRAAYELKRRFLGTDIDKYYCNVAIKRLQQETMVGWDKQHNPNLNKEVAEVEATLT